MYCNKCKFFRKDTSKYFEGISLSCSKYVKHLGFANKIGKVRSPKWCEEVKKNE